MEIADSRAAYDKRNKDAAEAALLWHSLISETQPGSDQFMLWIATYGLEIIKKAISATAKKAIQLRKQNVTLGEDIHRYCSACARNMKFKADGSLQNLDIVAAYNQKQQKRGR